MGGFLQTFPLTIFFSWKQLDAIATLVLHDVLRIPFGFAGSHVVDPANTTINKTCFVDRKCSLIFDMHQNIRQTRKQSVSATAMTSKTLLTRMFFN